MVMGLMHPGDRAIFLAVAIATHAIVGCALGARLFDAPLAGVAGGLLADADFLFPAAWEFPLVHRGLTHTLLAVAVVTAITAAATERSTAGAVAVGYGSHLAVDATTPKGILPLYPVSDAAHSVALSGHSPIATALLWTCSLGVLWLEYSEARRPAVEDVFGAFGR